MVKVAAVAASAALLIVAASIVLGAPDHGTLRSAFPEAQDCQQLQAECEARCGSSPDFHCKGQADALKWSCACGGKAAASVEQALGAEQAPPENRSEESHWCRRQRKNCERGCGDKSKTRFMCDDDDGARSVACSCVSGSGKGGASTHAGGSSSTSSSGGGSAFAGGGGQSFASAGNQDAFKNNPAWDQVNKIMHGR